MSLKKITQRSANTPPVLVIECANPSQNIILALEDLEENNKSLRHSINDANSQLELLKKILGNI